MGICVLPDGRSECLVVVPVDLARQRRSRGPPVDGGERTAVHQRRVQRGKRREQLNGTILYLSLFE